MRTQHTDTNPGCAHPYEDILDKLIALGTDLAQQVHAQAGKALPLDQATIAFDRIARAVRRTINLARHLAKPAATPAHDTRHATAARKRIIREVEDAITRDAEGRTAQSLHAELRERLDDPSLEDEIEGRSTEDIIKDILRDLGLGHMGPKSRFARRTPADIQALNTRAAARPAQTSPAQTSPAHTRPANTGPAPTPRTALKEN